MAYWICDTHKIYGKIENGDWEEMPIFRQWHDLRIVSDDNAIALGYKGT